MINVFMIGCQCAIILSVIDTVKGASGQAIQNMNIMCDFDEDTGIVQQPLFP